MRGVESQTKWRIGRIENYWCPQTSSVKVSVTTCSPATVVPRIATTFVSTNRGMPDRQRHASIRRGQEQAHHTRELFETKVDAPISPTAVNMPSKSGTTSSVLRLAHTSCVSTACGARESSWDARAPKSRPRAGRTRERRMSRDELFPVHKPHRRE